MIPISGKITMSLLLVIAGLEAKATGNEIAFQITVKTQIAMARPLFQSLMAPRAQSSRHIHGFPGCFNCSASRFALAAAPYRTPIMSTRPPSVKTPPTMIATIAFGSGYRSEEHTSELQSQSNLVCRLLLENKKRCLSDE